MAGAENSRKHLKTAESNGKRLETGENRRKMFIYLFFLFLFLLRSLRRILDANGGR